ncbi:unnamed protein product [Albugo candida]|uniref:Uncharacterized protein n=1 Tax=Albugo candida TaxID=65357 RepID=A0A024GHE7_9STRA|nr:unnamed protein product [Albugo candida]|eukprot:CCI45896.1 unnamed protein product [Albugo candida]
MSSSNILFEKTLRTISIFYNMRPTNNYLCCVMFESKTCPTHTLYPPSKLMKMWFNLQVVNESASKRVVFVKVQGSAIKAVSIHEYDRYANTQDPINFGCRPLSATRIPIWQNERLPPHVMYNTTIESNLQHVESVNARYSGFSTFTSALSSVYPAEADTVVSCIR